MIRKSEPSELTAISVEIEFLFAGIAEVDFMLHIFLRSDESGLGEFFVITRNFNLLAVFRDFLHVVAQRSKLLKLLFEVMFHFACNLIGTLRDDADGFVDITGVRREFDHVAGHRVGWSVCLLVIHYLNLDIVTYCFLIKVSVLNFARCYLEDIICFLAVGTVGVVVDESVIFINNGAEALGLLLLHALVGLLKTGFED